MKYKDLSLDDLFLLAKKGDGTAFEQIVLNTEKQLYNLALSYLKSREDAEDAVQDIYLRLWRKLPSFRGEGAKYYIFKTARNICIDALRKNASSPQIDDLIYENNGEKYEQEIADTDVDSRPDEAYIHNLKKETLRRCLDKLPVSAREMIILRDVNRLSYAEIGKILSLPDGTVKSKLFRSRERLKKLLLEEKDLF